MIAPLFLCLTEFCLQYERNSELLQNKKGEIAFTLFAPNLP